MVHNLWKNISLSAKASVLAFTLIATPSILILNAQSAMAASLKPVSIVNGSSLTLGDIFDGVKTNADYVIGAAPAPGEEMTLNARTLYRIAIAMNLPWRPLSTSDQVVVRRDAAVISYMSIEKELRNALISKGVIGNFNITVNSGKPTIILPNDAPKTMEISSLDFDVQNDYFRAVIASPSIDNPLEKISMTGLIERLVKVPTLRSNLQNGDIIGMNDIEMIEIPQNKLQHNMIMDAEDMVGLTPRRIAYAGKLVPEGSLERPQLVGRGDNVSITFTEGPLTLNAKGKALQSGAKGDMIRVTNINSSRTVDAFVTGSYQVVAR